jgi:hypothetical protein
MAQRSGGPGRGKPKAASAEPAGQVIRLRWASDADLATHYANQVHISHVGPEFTLIFGEAHLPPRNQGEQYDTELPIRPIVRIAVAPEVMIQMREVIDRNVDAYVAKGSPE